MRPKQHETRGSGDLFRARLDQIINMRHELAQLAGKIDWDFIDGEITPLYSDRATLIWRDYRRCGHERIEQFCSDVASSRGLTLSR